LDPPKLGCKLTQLGSLEYLALKFDLEAQVKSYWLEIWFIRN